MPIIDGQDATDLIYISSAHPSLSLHFNAPQNMGTYLLCTLRYCAHVRLWAPLIRSTTVSGEGTNKLNYSCKLTLMWALVELQKLNSWQSWSGLFCKTTRSSTLTCYVVHLYRFVTHLPHRSPKAPKSEGSTELQLCDTAFIARGVCIYNMSMRKNGREREREDWCVWRR